MDLIRDVLDNQLVDRDGVPMGKVDGLVIVLREGRPPRLAFVETGSVALARRPGPRVGRWVERLATRLGGPRHAEPYRIPWGRVRKVGITVELDIDADETPVGDWQDWLRRHVVGRIPGA